MLLQKVQLLQQHASGVFVRPDQKACGHCQGRCTLRLFALFAHTGYHLPKHRLQYRQGAYYVHIKHNELLTIAVLYYSIPLVVLFMVSGMAYAFACHDIVCALLGLISMFAVQSGIVYRLSTVIQS